MHFRHFNVHSMYLYAFFVFLCAKWQFVMCYNNTQAKLTAQTVLQEKCSVNQTAMNDCNWCVCDKDNKFVCTARNCSEIDLLGNFNGPNSLVIIILATAIGSSNRNIFVGVVDTIQKHIMKGNGLRSTYNTTPCQPGMHYQRHELLCICTNRGIWPNPVCRDNFRFLYEVIRVASSGSSFSCTPGQVYIFNRCSVCFCPPEGYMQQQHCFANCTQGDPLVYTDEYLKAELQRHDALEIYFECDEKKIYKLGCRTCNCLKNNRMLCDNCNEVIWGWHLFSEKPPQMNTIPFENCTAGQQLVNECSYCICEKNIFICLFRACRRVDEIGYFEDSIRDYMVTASRTDPGWLNFTVCQPNRTYVREGMLCACDEEGYWPSPACREVFRVIYEIYERRVVTFANPPPCVPRKIYLIGCSACLCGDDGKIAICNQYPCQVMEPIHMSTRDIMKRHRKTDVTVYYAVCVLDSYYSHGCRRCLCLQSNRLLCDNCNREFGTSMSPFPFKSPEITPLNYTNCTSNQRLLNDCNWCMCERDRKIVCAVRQCRMPNMFGLYPDWIRLVLHQTNQIKAPGILRSSETECQPQMHYQRGELLCICSDDGDWPTSECRDAFGTLYEVEKVDNSPPTPQKCTPSHLYLFGCNVCYCPPEGTINPDSCTNFDCPEETLQQFKEDEENDEIFEVYADCEPFKQYKIGCRNCFCFKNNRLLCNKCKEKKAEDYCTKTEGKVFNLECNTCICSLGKMYCTTKKCLKHNYEPEVTFNQLRKLQLIEPPLDSINCIPGTKFKKECNICHCMINSRRRKILSCTLKKCQEENKAIMIKNDCVVNTVYEADCRICRCDEVNGVKHESCLVYSICDKEGTNEEEKEELEVKHEEEREEVKYDDLNSLHGYCEPTHVYRRECNTCKCLSDGKIAACSARICGRSNSSQSQLSDEEEEDFFA